jgi:peptidyl-prolyl cis-trans isomerase D
MVLLNCPVERFPAMMFISHFNKLIRNKILWMIIIVIIAISFVLWTTQTSGSRARNAQENRIGKLDGKAVPPEEYQAAYFQSLLAMELMFGRPIPINAQVDAALRGMAWRRLVSLRAAQAMRITVTEEEMNGAIRQQQIFCDNGQFQQERYDAFVERFLSRLQANEAQFLEHIRQELLLSKVKRLLAQAAWVAPLEVEQVFHQLHDTFVVSYVVLDRADVALSVKVSEDQAKAFFEGQREAFKIPEKMRVKWVAFPIEQFLDEGSSTEAALRDYYEEHIEDFTTRGSNDQWIAKPFEAVEDELRAARAWDEAANQAGERALNFEVMLAPDRLGKAPGFAEAARSANLTVTTSDFFSVRQPIPGLEDDLQFSKAAFELRSTPDDYFSHALKGTNAYYILAVAERSEARLPEYAEVRGEVRQAAIEQAITNKTEELARAFYDIAAAAVAKGVPFAKSLNGTGLEVLTTEPFKVKDGLENDEIEHFGALAGEALAHNPGEMTKLIPAKGGYVFGYVDSRVPASRALLESARANITRYLLSRRENLVFTDWQDYLLTSAKFEDLSSKPKAAPVVPEDEEPPPPVEDEFP